MQMGQDAVNSNDLNEECAHLVVEYELVSGASCRDKRVRQKPEHVLADADELPLDLKL